MDVNQYEERKRELTLETISYVNIGVNSDSEKERHDQTRS